METKEITKTVYIAYDGEEFLSKEDCEKYENFAKKYFHVLNISVSDVIRIWQKQGILHIRYM